MGTKDKLLVRFMSFPTDFTFDEMARLLSGFGYQVHSKGKTSGSRVLFVHPDHERPIMLHKPHPSRVMKLYALKQVFGELMSIGLIK